MRAEDHFLYRKMGDNTWELRSDPDSWNNACMVTMIPDGTVILSGDYGTLAFRREYYPERNNRCHTADRFPNERTCLSYFAEKVCQFPNGIQKTTSWDPERARKEIRELIVDMKLPEGETVDSMMEKLQFETEHEMVDELMDSETWLGWDCDTVEDIGTDYTSQFKFQLEILKQWTKCRDGKPLVDDLKRLLEKKIGVCEGNIRHQTKCIKESPEDTFWHKTHTETLEREGELLIKLRKAYEEEIQKPKDEVSG